MKKTLAILLSLIFLLSVSACSPKTEQENPGADMTLSEIMAEILNGVPDLPSLMETELDSESFQYFLFIDYIEGSEALSSEAMINAIPHSVVLLRLPDGADAAAVAADIEANANPNKWICVIAEKTVVAHRGNLVLLVMSMESTADAIVANFNDKL